MHLKFAFTRTQPSPALPARAAKREQSAAGQSRPRRRPATWDELHLRALRHDGSDDSAWLKDFGSRVRGGCQCRSHWRKILRANPPRWSEYFAWSVEVHNAVNALPHLTKPQLALDQARAIWSSLSTANQGQP